MVANTRRRIAGTLLPLAALLMLSGCAGLQVRLGMKVNLEKIPVTSIQAYLPKGPGIAPGEKSPLIVKFTQPDGSILMTEGKRRGQGPMERHLGHGNRHRCQQ